MVIDKIVVDQLDEKLKEQIIIKREIDHSIELADNAMLKHRPDLFDEWDFDKNDELGIDIYKMTRSHGKKVWWNCLKCTSSYEASTNSRGKSGGCPYCVGKKVNHTNNLATLKPMLLSEWNFSLNKDISPQEVTCGSHKKVWWKCLKCNSDYDMTVKNKTSHSQGCPYCSGKRANHTNSLAALNPVLASQWHPTKNKEKTPQNFTTGSGKKVWWLGKCGHEWEAIISDRNVGNGCHYCAKSNAKVLKGYNDMWTTNPKLASFLANHEDGYLYSQSSEKKVDWKCKDCGFILADKSIAVVNMNGLACPSCSDGRKYPEKFMFNLLKDLNINFEPEKIFEWNKSKRYDFYLNDYNIIIETHGEQHYNRIKGMFYSQRTLKEEQANDKFKEDMASMNKVSDYYVVDCRVSEVDFIVNSIKECGLLKVINPEGKEIDWNKYNKMSMHSFVKIAADLWNKGYFLKEIEKELKVSGVTVNKYLKKAHNAGLCEYKRDRSRNAPNLVLRKKIVQLDLDGNFIREWESIKSAGLFFNSKKAGSISKALQKDTSTGHGYLWRLADEYYKKYPKEVN